MGHNSVVSDHPKSTGIPQVDGLSTGPPDLGCHTPSTCDLDISISDTASSLCYSGFREATS